MAAEMNRWRKYMVISSCETAQACAMVPRLREGATAVTFGLRRVAAPPPAPTVHGGRARTEPKRTPGSPLAAGGGGGLPPAAFHTAPPAADPAPTAPAQAASGAWRPLLPLLSPPPGGASAGLAPPSGFPAARGSGIP